jgi:hypothetical protein
MMTNFIKRVGACYQIEELYWEILLPIGLSNFVVERKSPFREIFWLLG